MIMMHAPFSASHMPPLWLQQASVVASAVPSHEGAATVSGVSRFVFAPRVGVVVVSSWSVAVPPHPAVSERPETTRAARTEGRIDMQRLYTEVSVVLAPRAARRPRDE
jgi:hypothetical protein